MPLFTGNWFGFGKSSSGAAGPPGVKSGYEILHEEINGSYSANTSGAVTLPSDYSQPGSIVIVYGSAAGGSGRAGMHGDEGMAGGGGGSTSANPSGVTTPVTAGDSISWQVACGTLVKAPGVTVSPGGNDGADGQTTHVLKNGTTIVELGGGKGAPQSTAQDGNESTFQNNGTGTCQVGGKGGQGSTRPGGGGAVNPGYTSPDPHGNAGGGGGGGHLSPHRNGAPGGPAPASWVKTYTNPGASWDMNDGNPIVVRKNTTPAGTHCPPGTYITSVLSSTYIRGSARASAGYHDGNSGGNGGCGGGLSLEIDDGAGSYRNLVMSSPPVPGGGTFPPYNGAAGGGGGGTACMTSGFRYPPSTPPGGRFEPSNWRTGGSPHPQSPILTLPGGIDPAPNPGGIASGGGGLVLIIGRAGPA